MDDVLKISIRSRLKVGHFVERVFVAAFRGFSFFNFFRKS
mgnify:CR=1 FL=1